MKNEDLTMKNKWAARAKFAFALVLATLREIFDENAYARFLSRHDLVPSRQSYQAFQRENTYARERRPRCC